MLTLLPCSDEIFDVGSGRSDSAIFQVYYLLYSFHSPKRGLIFYASSAWPNRPIGGHREGLGQSIQVKQHCEALWRFSQPHRDDPSALRRRRKARRPSRQTANKYRLREGGRLCGSSMCWTAGTVVPRGRPPSALRARPS